MTLLAARTPCARYVPERVQYELFVTPPARRAIAQQLPEAVAAAVIEFLTGSLVQRRRVVGRPLRGELAGVWSARRGTDGVLYRVLDEAQEVVVLSVQHWRDAYRA